MIMSNDEYKKKTEKYVCDERDGEFKDNKCPYKTRGGGCARGYGGCSIRTIRKALYEDSFKDIEADDIG